MTYHPCAEEAPVARSQVDRAARRGGGVASMNTARKAAALTIALALAAAGCSALPGGGSGWPNRSSRAITRHSTRVTTRTKASTLASCWVGRRSTTSTRSRPGLPTSGQVGCPRCSSRAKTAQTWSRSPRRSSAPAPGWRRSRPRTSRRSRTSTERRSAAGCSGTSPSYSPLS